MVNYVLYDSETIGNYVLPDGRRAAAEALSQYHHFITTDPTVFEVRGDMIIAVRRLEEVRYNFGLSAELTPVEVCIEATEIRATKETQAAVVAEGATASVTADERIAAALEFLVLLMMPAETE